MTEPWVLKVTAAQGQFHQQSQATSTGLWTCNRDLISRLVAVSQGTPCVDRQPQQWLTVRMCVAYCTAVTVSHMYSTE